jgi:hypothetical protein
MSNEQNIELPVTLAYSLGSSDHDNCLVINNGAHHVVFDADNRSPFMLHTITWKLVGNAANGDFCALDDEANPGFTWLVRKPNPNWVRLDEKACGKKQLTLLNTHVHEGSRGHWYYQLFARFPNNRTYGVPLTFAAGTASNPNPSIKNR